MIEIDYKKKPKIRQMQIDDYIGKFHLEIYQKWIPEKYHLVRKRFADWIPIRKYKKAEKRGVVNQKIPISAYFKNKTDLILPKAPYLRRFRGIPQYTYVDFAKTANISRNEWNMFQNLPNFKGFFNHLFELNDLTYFDDVQATLEKEGKRFKKFFLYDIIAFELMRRQLGLADYAGLDKMYEFTHVHPLRTIVHNPFRYPMAVDISYILNLIPDQIFIEFFQMLVQDAIDLGIIEPRILLWDGQFLRSDCNNNYKNEKAKKAKQYNDQEAGYIGTMARKMV